MDAPELGGKFWMTIFLPVYLFNGLSIYATTNTRSAAGEIDSLNLLAAFGDVNKTYPLSASTTSASTFLPA